MVVSRIIEGPIQGAGYARWMSGLSPEAKAEVCRTWSPDSLVTFYNWVYEGTGITFPDHMYPVAFALCDKRIQKLMLQIGPGSGKSVLLTTVYPAWLLGHDPTQTILGISGAESLIQGFVEGSMDFIANSEAFKLAFPHVTPAKDRGWSSSQGMYVKGYRSGTPDASYWGCGLKSKALTGKHARTIILDDLHDAENSATEEQCKEVVRKYASQIVGRADAMGARYLLAGRRWNVKDLYGVLERSEDWVVMRLPAERPGSRVLYYDVYVPDFSDPETKQVPFECVFTDGCVNTFDGQVIRVKENLPYMTPMEELEI